LESLDVTRLIVGIQLMPYDCVEVIRWCILLHRAYWFKFNA
jgi:hypothetical protein